jgi:hypothetical protein
MAWNKPSANDLKEAGLDPEAFKAAMMKLEKFDEMATGLTKLKESVDGFASLKDTLASLENKLKEIKPVAASGGGSGNGDGNAGGGSGSGEGNKEEDLDWMLEPEKATQATISKMVAPVIAATADMRARMHYTTFESQNKRGFRKFKTEIDELYNKQSINAKQSPELIENCYKIIMANHIDEISKGGESFFIEPGGSSSGAGGGTGDPKKKAVEVLSKDALELCAKWGVDPEEYLKEQQAGGATTYA